MEMRDLERVLEPDVLQLSSDCFRYPDVAILSARWKSACRWPREVTNVCPTRSVSRKPDLDQRSLGAAACSVQLLATAPRDDGARREWRPRTIPACLASR
jgi:hypothetical protein